MKHPLLTCSDYDQPGNKNIQLRSDLNKWNNWKIIKQWLYYDSRRFFSRICARKQSYLTQRVNPSWKRTLVEPILLSVEWCPRYGGVIFCILYFGTKRLGHCTKVSTLQRCPYSDFAFLGVCALRAYQGLNHSLGNIPWLTRNNYQIKFQYSTTTSLGIGKRGRSPLNESYMFLRRHSNLPFRRTSRLLSALR